VQAAAEAPGQGTLLGLYEFSAHKSRPETRTLDELAVVEFDQAKLPAIEAGVKSGGQSPGRPPSRATSSTTPATT
jgi:hypothetical protein